MPFDCPGQLHGWSPRPAMSVSGFWLTLACDVSVFWLSLACFVVDQAHGLTHHGLVCACFLSKHNHKGLCLSSGYWGWLPCLPSTGSFRGQLGGLTAIGSFLLYLFGDYTCLFFTHDGSGKTFHCYMYLLFISTNRTLLNLFYNEWFYLFFKFNAQFLFQDKSQQLFNL